MNIEGNVNIKYSTLKNVINTFSMDQCNQKIQFTVVFVCLFVEMEEESSQVVSLGPENENLSAVAELCFDLSNVLPKPSFSLQGNLPMCF